MKIFKKFVFSNVFLILVFFNYGQAMANSSCPINLKTSYSDGEVGCLTDLPLSKIINKKWNRSIGEIAKTAMYYEVVVSDSCKIYEIFTVSPSALNPTVWRDRHNSNVSSFIANCSANCKCSSIIKDGSVSISKVLAMALDPTAVAALEPSKTPENSASISDNLKKEIILPAQPVVANQVRAPDQFKSERDSLAADLEASRKRQQYLEEQLRLSQVAKQNEQERLMAEQKAKDEQNAKDIQKIADEAKLKEQQQLLLLAAQQMNQERLMADLKLKEQLRIADEASKANALELSKLKEELASITLRKQDAKPIASNRKALVIGNDNYSGVPKLANARQDANTAIKKDKDLTTDEQKALETTVQEYTNKFNKEIDTICATKEQEVMTI